MLITFRRTANMVLCMLMLHNCQSRLNVTPNSDELPAAAFPVSGLHAQEENKSPITESSAISYILELLHSTTISQAVASQSQRVPPRPMLYTPVSMVPSDRVIRSTDMYTHLSSDSCAYLDNMGLLGGMPVSEKKQTKWVIGPSITINPNNTRTEVYHIPFGYRYKDYRVKQDSELTMQGASWTIYYVEAQSPGEISKLAEFTDGGALEAKLAADFVNVVTLGKLEGGTQHSISKAHQDMQAPGCIYAALVVHGHTTTNWPFHEKSQIRLELEIEIEAKEYQEQQVSFHKKMLPQGKHDEEQANTPKKEIDASFREEDVALSIEMLSLEEKAKLEGECDKKLSAVQQEEVSEQEYAQLLKQQENSKKEIQAVLIARIAELSGSQQAPEQQQLQTAGLPAIAFGASAWRKYYGEVGEEPRLPHNIEDILNSPCPFWMGSTVRDTHLLVLIPAKVNDQSFSLNLLRELIRQPRSGEHRTAEYSYYGEKTQQQIGAASPEASYWLLMTRSVLPGSRNKNYKSQKKLVADYARQKHLLYRLPQALEAATAILTHHVRSGERLYTDNPWTYTRCQELICDNFSKYPAVIGGFGTSGLFVNCNIFDSGIGTDGVAGCWVF